jgi:GAF domain-containing protein/ligand-binding sensor protein
MGNQPESRYELTELVEPGDIERLVEAFSRALSVSAGIVRNPKPEEKECPKNIDELKKWRLTPIVTFDNQGEKIDGGSRFCSAIRTLEGGNQRCMESDMTEARSAFNQRKALKYHCYPAGLIDMVAAIRVGGHHLANVYFGQLRDKTSRFETAWSEYQTIKANSTNAQDAIERHELEKLFGELRTEESTIGVDQLIHLLQQLSDLISRKAAREAVVRFIDEIGREIVSSFDLSQGMEIILRKVGRLIRFDSGCIWVEHEKQLRPCATFYPAEIRNRHIEIDTEKGVTALIFKNGKTIRCDNLEQMDRIRPAAIAGSRQKRGLQSFLGTPLILDDKTVGVIELSSISKHIYTEDDERLIELIAKYVCLHLKSHRENQILLNLAREKDLDKLFRIVVTGVPALVNGRGCSIFLRRRLSLKLPGDTKTSLTSDEEVKSLPAILVETTELNTDLVGRAMYKADVDDGLTSAILVKGIELNIPGRKEARTTWLTKNFPGLVWKGKYATHDRFDKAYYTDRPFMGVPIKTQVGVLGVIRVGDAVSNKKQFSSNDLSILKSCASEVAFALEAKSLGNSLSDISEKLKELHKQNADIIKSCKTISSTRVSSTRKDALPFSSLFLYALPAMLGCGISATLASLALATPFRLKLLSFIFCVVSASAMAYGWNKSVRKQRETGHNQDKSGTLNRVIEAYESQRGGISDKED